MKKTAIIILLSIIIVACNKVPSKPEVVGPKTPPNANPIGNPPSNFN